MAQEEGGASAARRRRPQPLVRAHTAVLTQGSAPPAPTRSKIQTSKSAALIADDGAGGGSVVRVASDAASPRRRQSKRSMTLNPDVMRKTASSRSAPRASSPMPDEESGSKEHAHYSPRLLRSICSSARNKLCISRMEARDAAEEEGMAVGVPSGASRIKQAVQSVIESTRSTLKNNRTIELLRKVGEENRLQREREEMERQRVEREAEELRKQKLEKYSKMFVADDETKRGFLWRKGVKTLKRKQHERLEDMRILLSEVYNGDSQKQLDCMKLLEYIQARDCAMAAWATVRRESVQRHGMQAGFHVTSALSKADEHASSAPDEKHDEAEVKVVRRKLEDLVKIVNDLRVFERLFSIATQHGSMAEIRRPVEVRRQSQTEVRDMEDRTSRSSRVSFRPGIVAERQPTVHFAGNPTSVGEGDEEDAASALPGMENENVEEAEEAALEEEADADAAAASCIDEEAAPEKEGDQEVVEQAEEHEDLEAADIIDSVDAEAADLEGFRVHGRARPSLGSAAASSADEDRDEAGVSRQRSLLNAGWSSVNLHEPGPPRELAVSPSGSCDSESSESTILPPPPGQGACIVLLTCCGAKVAGARSKVKTVKRASITKGGSIEAVLRERRARQEQTGATGPAWRALTRGALPIRPPPGSRPATVGSRPGIAGWSSIVTLGGSVDGGGGGVELPGGLQPTAPPASAAAPASASGMPDAWEPLSLLKAARPISSSSRSRMPSLRQPCLVSDSKQSWKQRYRRVAPPINPSLAAPATAGPLEAVV